MRSGLDVRTRLFVVLVVDLLLFSVGAPLVRELAAALLVALFALSGHWRAAALLAGCLACATALLWFPLRRTAAFHETLFHQTNWAGALLAALLYSIPYLLAGGYGYWFARSTAASELVGGLSRMRLPQSAVVPSAVMLRFAVTVCQDAAAIGEAMRLRGLSSFSAAALHPIRTVEYLIVPLLTASTRSGEALAAAAMCRGLGSPARPTTTARLGFGMLDAIAFLAVAAIAAAALRQAAPR